MTYLVDLNVLLEDTLTVEDVVAQLIGKVDDGHGLPWPRIARGQRNRCSCSHVVVGIAIWRTRTT